MRIKRSLATLGGIVLSTINHNSARLIGVLFTITVLGTACSNDGPIGPIGPQGDNCKNVRNDGEHRVEITCGNGPTTYVYDGGYGPGSNGSGSGSSGSNNSGVAQLSGQGVWACQPYIVQNASDITSLASYPTMADYYRHNGGLTNCKDLTTGDAPFTDVVAVTGNVPAHIVINGASFWGEESAAQDGTLSANGAPDVTFQQNDGTYVLVGGPHGGSVHLVQ